MVSSATLSIPLSFLKVEENLALTTTVANFSRDVHMLYGTACSV